MSDAAIIQGVRKALPHLPKDPDRMTERQALKSLEAMGYYPPPKAGYMVTQKNFDETAKQLKKKRTRDKAWDDAFTIVINRLKPKGPMNAEDVALWCHLLKEQIVDNESMMSLWLIYASARPLKGKEDLPTLWQEMIIIWGKYLMWASPKRTKMRIVWGIFWDVIGGREPVPFDVANEEGGMTSFDVATQEKEE